MTFTLSWTPPPPATEMRALIRHNGKLYGGTGNWLSTGFAAGPSIIRLDAPNTPWALEQFFPIAPVNRIAVACLNEIHFPTARLTTLICGFFGGSAVGLKTSTGAWVVTPIGNRRGQIRSFTAHVDSVSHVDLAFAGSDQGIFSGVYDTALPGEIMWASTPELDISGFPPLARGHSQRVMSFAELRGVLYATIGQDIWERLDRAPAAWRKVWSNPYPGVSQSGLRGMTPVNGDLWVGVEGTNGRIVSVNATTWASTTEIDLSGPHHFYVIVAYNDMCILPNGVLLAGLDGAATSPAHYVVLNNGVWSRFALPPLAPSPMRSVRTICPSPFNSSEIYFGGFDCNGGPADNTAWVVNGLITDAVA